MESEESSLKKGVEILTLNEDTKTFIEGYLSNHQAPRLIENCSLSNKVQLEGFREVAGINMCPEYVGCLVLAFPIMAGHPMFPPVSAEERVIKLGRAIDSLYIMDWVNSDTEKFIQNLPRIEGMIFSQMPLPTDAITEDIAFMGWVRG
jgi:hypothetical protein